MVAGHVDRIGLKQHQLHFSSVLHLFSCACFYSVLLAPLLSPPLLLSLNIPSKTLSPNRESCSCRQFFPIFQVTWAESLPWTRHEESHPAEEVAAPSDNQEGPGQGIHWPQSTSWSSHPIPTMGLPASLFFLSQNPTNI